MSKTRRVVYTLTAMALSGLLVALVYVLQLKQLEMQRTVNVVAAHTFIPSGTVLTADLLEIRPVFVGSYRPEMFTNMEEVLGMESVVPLGTQEPLLEWKLNTMHLLPTNDQSTFQIPKDYILSISNGIRAGDRVRIYVSDAEEGSRRLFPHEVVVASVKSANNVEVDNPKNSNLLSRASGDAEKMYISRLEANGPIDQINLNLTEEEWLLIDQICSTRKAKLVISFTSSSITEIDDSMGREGL